MNCEDCPLSSLCPYAEPVPKEEELPDFVGVLEDIFGKGNVFVFDESTPPPPPLPGSLSNN